MFKFSFIIFCLFGITFSDHLRGAQEDTQETFYSDYKDILVSTKNNIAKVNGLPDALIVGTNLIYCVTQLPIFVTDHLLKTKPLLTNTITALSYGALALHVVTGNPLYSYTNNFVAQALSIYLETIGVCALARLTAVGNLVVNESEKV